MRHEINKHGGRYGNAKRPLYRAYFFVFPPAAPHIGNRCRIYERILHTITEDAPPKQYIASLGTQGARMLREFPVDEGMSDRPYDGRHSGGTDATNF